MPYPVRHAALLLKAVDDYATQVGAEIFVGEIEDAGVGEGYRKVTLDVEPNDWRRLQTKLMANGWKVFSGSNLVYSLPEGTFLLLEPNI